MSNHNRDEFVTRRLTLKNSRIVNCIHDIIRYRYYAPGKDLSINKKDDMKAFAPNWLLYGLLIDKLRSGDTTLRIPFLTFDQMKSGLMLEFFNDDEMMRQVVEIDLSTVASLSELTNLLMGLADAAMPVDEPKGLESDSAAPVVAATAKAAPVVSVDAAQEAAEAIKAAFGESVEEVVQDEEPALKPEQELVAESTQEAEIDAQPEVEMESEPEGDAHKQLDLVDAVETSTEQHEEAGKADETEETEEAEEEDESAVEFEPIEAAPAKASALSDAKAKHAELMKRLHEGGVGKTNN
ncbi:hypothetical protein F3I62_18795 [Pseudomonas sp. R-28-1W-6]|uniref:hypothetical protein n=1 Tax=Pseudomonas sp. R-28-1W-6 TaxID=2650101 RepID=UPI0013665E13|nr:hypothetical protein [Pseudomonas sp. R-28-1W-6]MWV14153.1 hypothetical protein [Pseudomonas sp. R-28-1W-6]